MCVECDPTDYHQSSWLKEVEMDGDLWDGVQVTAPCWDGSGKSKTLLMLPWPEDCYGCAVNCDCEKWGSGGLEGVPVRCPSSVRWPSWASTSLLGNCHNHHHNFPPPFLLISFHHRNYFTIITNRHNHHHNQTPPFLLISFNHHNHYHNFFLSLIFTHFMQRIKKNIYLFNYFKFIFNKRIKKNKKNQKEYILFF